jgi:catechol 2,3-dioxygenase-like lactoylglutathione lyase family enzyme
MIPITGTNVTIMVNDIDKAIQFYESIGLIVKQRWENHYAMMTAAGITIGLHPTEDLATNSGTVSIGFMVAAIDGIKAVLTKNNIPYTDSDDGKSGIYVHFKDPYGTALYFVKPKWE